ncbi:MAG: cyclic nucleotide-binding domain-containing protein [Candidatus Tectomicrobia bacterium]|nr:cyclic nucleotide-binding domain-containing protein [Candidatus Tectomicrobia bacterium]
MRRQTLEPIISQHRFFQDLEPAYLRFIVECAANVRFKAEEFLFHEGEAANQFYLIRHGRVALQIFIPGRGPTTLVTIEAGEVLGWSWLFPPYRWHFDARAVELTRAIAFEGQCLRDKCDADPKLGYVLMQRFSRIMTQRLQAARLQLVDMYGAELASQRGP